MDPQKPFKEKDASTTSGSTSTSSTTEKVKVFIRVKPLTPIPTSTTSTSSQPQPQTIITVNNPPPPNPHTLKIPGTTPDEQLVFPFDHIFDTTSTQSEIYTQIKMILVDEVLRGRNATVFAYGQTGAGKTHSIVGTKMDPGILPRIVKDVLERLKGLVDNSAGSAGKQNGNVGDHENFGNVVSATLKAGWMECYQEKLYDLRDKCRKTLELFGDRMSTRVQGLSTVEITDYEQFSKEHDSAWKARATAATKLNMNSSRSHFVLQLSIEITRTGGKTLKSKLNICDLAGSENNKRTGNQGERMNESRAINKSLFELGRVVEALNQGQSNVIYRNSSLTRLLQDALGGSAVAVVLACLSGDDYMETLSTLKFGAKCRSIQNTVIVNETVAPPPPPPPPPQPAPPARSSMDGKIGGCGGGNKENLGVGDRKRSSLDSLGVGSGSGSDVGGIGGGAKRVKVGEGVMKRAESVEDLRLSEALRSTQEMQQRLEQMKSKLQAAESINQSHLLQQQQQQQQLQQQSTSATTTTTIPNESESLKAKTEAFLLTELNSGNLNRIKALNTIGPVRAKKILGLWESLREKSGNSGGFVSLKELGPVLSSGQIEGLFRANIPVEFHV
ncbi:Kinesin-like protein kif22 [Blyttiomyces sp. JEL0837]|nr:Kinesin-like protein kif22 [Blyttiomyces sp. JEL0837]